VTKTTTELEEGRWRPDEDDDGARGRSSNMKRAMTTAELEEGRWRPDEDDDGDTGKSTEDDARAAKSWSCKIK
jgi:hypothetical protein